MIFTGLSQRSPGLARRPARRAATSSLVSLFLVLALAGGASAATISGSSRGLHATMHVGTHHPIVGRQWPMQFTATRAGRPAKVTVTYEYLFGGQVVAVRAHHTFTGHFSDALVFPPSAEHEPLTFRAVIKAGAATIDLDYAIEVLA